MNAATNGNVLLGLYDGNIVGIRAQNRQVSPEFVKDVDSSDVSKIITLVKGYVDNALAQTNYSEINLTADGSVAKNEDGNYQISYDVSSNGAKLNGYTVSVTDADNNPYPADKVWIVDESGNPIQNGEVTCSETSCIDKFTVIVSKDVIVETKTNYVFKVDIHASFESLVGGIYQAKTNPDENQKVITVSTSSETYNADDQFVISEDTGMTTTQTIYFIG